MFIYIHLLHIVAKGKKTNKENPISSQQSVRRRVDVVACRSKRLYNCISIEPKRLRLLHIAIRNISYMDSQIKTTTYHESVDGFLVGLGQCLKRRRSIYRYVAEEIRIIQILVLISSSGAKVIVGCCSYRSSILWRSSSGQHQ